RFRDMGKDTAGDYQRSTAQCLPIAPESSALPANLCPVSGCVEFARFSDDFREAIREPVEAGACITVWEGTSEHCNRMLGSDQGIDYPTETSAKRCKQCFRLWSEVSRARAGQLEFPLEISQYHLEIAHGHLWIGMAE